MHTLLFEPGPGFSLFCAGILKRFILLPRALGVVQVLLTVSEEKSEVPVHLVYLGEGETLPYLCEILGTALSAEISPSLSPARLRRLIREAIGKKQIVIVELNRLLSFLLPRGGMISYPWIRQRILLAGSIYQLRKRKIEGTFGRKVRQNHYEYELSRDRSEILQFYEKHYIPHLERRFEGNLRARPLAELERAVRTGFLLKILHNGEWVAGAVCRADRDRLTALAFGMNWNRENEWKQGALSAAYYFLFRWAEQHAIREVDLLRSRPLARDGVYIHKSRWGAVPSADPWPHTQISFFIPPQAVIPAAIRSFLVREGRKFVQIQNCWHA